MLMAGHFSVPLRIWKIGFFNLGNYDYAVVEHKCYRYINIFYTRVSYHNPYPLFQCYFLLSQAHFSVTITMYSTIMSRILSQITSFIQCQRTARIVHVTNPFILGLSLFLWSFVYVIKWQNRQRRVPVNTYNLHIHPNFKRNRRGRGSVSHLD